MEDWKEGLSEDIRSHPSLEAYNPEKGMVSVPVDLVKSYVGQQSLIGKDKIPLPGENATDEDWNEVWTRLGRPETAEGYDLKKPEGLAEEIEYSEELVGEFKGECHKMGILPSQAQKLLDWFMGTNTKHLETLSNASKEYFQKSETELRKEWGAAYTQNVGLAQAAFNHFSKAMGAEGEKAITSLMEETGLGDHPLIMRFFSKIGEAIGEDVIAGKPKGMIMAPEQALAEIAKIQGDANGPYYKKDHPEHTFMVQKMADLFKMAYPEEEKPAAT